MKTLVGLGVAIFITASAALALAVESAVEEAQTDTTAVEEDAQTEEEAQAETASGPEDEVDVETESPGETPLEEPPTEPTPEPSPEPPPEPVETEETTAEQVEGVASDDPEAESLAGCDDDELDQHRSFVIGGLVLTPIGIVDLAIGTAMLAVTVSNEEGGLGEGFLGTASIITMAFGAAFTAIGAILWGMGRARRRRCEQVASRIPSIAVGHDSASSAWAFALSWRL